MHIIHQSISSCQFIIHLLKKFQIITNANKSLRKSKFSKGSWDMSTNLFTTNGISVCTFPLFSKNSSYSINYFHLLALFSPEYWILFEWIEKAIYTYIEIELCRQQWWWVGRYICNRTNAKILITERVKLTLWLFFHTIFLHFWDYML